MFVSMYRHSGHHHGKLFRQYSTSNTWYFIPILVKIISVSVPIAYWRYDQKIIKIGEAVQANRCASPIVTELAYYLCSTYRKRKYDK
jgi:hypothetical protein